MISKRELLDIASTSGLNPHVIEKDYTLGWALAGIAAHPELTETWVFKGGTCLKKCYFETYRFSEDLDFTLTDGSHLEQAFLSRVFSDVSEWIYEQSGLEFPPQLQDFDLYENPRGAISCQGKLSYRGPVSPQSGGLPRIKLDLTADERVVLPPARIPIFHPYSDRPEDGIEVLAYAYEEAFAEKVRALGERSRPRDLYDVINLYRNVEARPTASVMLDVLQQKCAFKGIAVPAAAHLDPHRPTQEAGWCSMLAHQLPALPPVDAFWDVLPEFFAWLTGAEAAPEPASYALGGGESIVRERTLRLPLPTAALSHLEIIRFAAANRLCVELAYQGSTRYIEPYSLRQTQQGNFVLHAWNIDSDAHRSYRIDRIEGARITGQSFTPRYAVELTPSGPLPVQITQRSSGGRTSGAFGRETASANPRRRGPRRHSASSFQGVTYIYECPMCGKKFRRQKMSGRLNKHKKPDGLPCGGRTGFLVDTKF